MNNNLFNVVINSIKIRFVALTARLRMWLNPAFIRTRIFGRIRTFFAELFDVKPRHKDDYYRLMGWLISKRLAFAVVVLAGTLSLIYLIASNSDIMERSKVGGIKTYNYNSIPLRFAKGEVRIKARRGYIAYQGSVKGGACNGNGNLYGENGNLVYQGNFVNNKYEGHGTSYYKSGSRAHTGEYYNNLYEGEGKAYRESGSLLYDGEFSKGLKEGTGKLFDESASLVYTGQFSADCILYAEMLGKTAQEVRQMYLGSRSIYSNTDTGEAMVMMPQITALYRGSVDNDSTAGELTVDEVYVISDTFRIGTGVFDNINDLSKYLGPPSYQGTSAVEPAEAVIINYINEKGSEDIMYGDVQMDSVVTFTDFREISNVDRDYQIYLYSYDVGGLVYTFICKDNDGKFDFYSVVTADG